MKKFIPIFTITITLGCMQNCANRDEDTISNSHQINEIKKNLMMRGDSTKLPEEIIDPDPDPDPPVRDGDNWRTIPVH